MVMKKMLIPDSLASFEVSSTLSVGQPSSTTTATLGTPRLFPLALEKKFLVTKEMARPEKKKQKQKLEHRVLIGIIDTDHSSTKWFRKMHTFLLHFLLGYFKLLQLFWVFTLAAFI